MLSYRLNIFPFWDFLMGLSDILASYSCEFLFEFQFEKSIYTPALILCSFTYFLPKFIRKIKAFLALFRWFFLFLCHLACNLVQKYVFKFNPSLCQPKNIFRIFKK